MGNKLNKEITKPLSAAGKTTLANGDLLGHIQSFSSLKDATALSCSSKALHAVLKRTLLQQKANLLLKHISAGNLIEAEKLIQQTPKTNRLALLKQPAKAKDYFGRQFSRMTAFQYTLWDVSARPARDLLMRHIPDEEITRQLQAHYDNNDEGYNRHGRHFDFMPLIKALQDYVIFVDRPVPHVNWDEANQKWQKEVGGAQRWLTAEIIHQYCRPSCNFENPRDSFASKTAGLLPEERKDMFFYWKTMMNVHLRDYLDDLGSILALYRGSEKGAYDGLGVDFNQCVLDLEAITALCEVRIQEFNALIERFAPALSLLPFPHQSPPLHTSVAP